MRASRLAPTRKKRSPRIFEQARSASPCSFGPSGLTRTPDTKSRLRDTRKDTEREVASVGPLFGNGLWTCTIIDEQAKLAVKVVLEWPICLSVSFRVGSRFARAEGVGLPDERSEELCGAKSQEAESRFRVAAACRGPKAERARRRVAKVATMRRQSNNGMKRPLRPSGQRVDAPFQAAERRSASRQRFRGRAQRFQAATAIFRFNGGRA